MQLIRNIYYVPLDIASRFHWGAPKVMSKGSTSDELHYSSTLYTSDECRLIENN